MIWLIEECIKVLNGHSTRITLRHILLVLHFNNSIINIFNYNLVYTWDYFNLHNFNIKHEGKIITNHNFEEQIFDKFVDTTDNLNFIHKL